MTELRRKMIEDMKLRGLSENTRKNYAYAIAHMAIHFGRSPEVLTEEDIRNYFLYRTDHDKVAAQTCTRDICAIKFLYEHTLQREWPVLDLLRPKKSYKLPIILSQEEILDIVSRVNSPHHRMAFQLIYSCGLRLSEALAVTIPDIDGKRSVLRIDSGKGNKDRYVPLAKRTLTLLRDYWETFRPEVHFFLNRETGKPYSPKTLQGAFGLALRETKIKKKASIHTLLHSYATHLLENGIDIRLIQRFLGHKSPKTTIIYAQITSRIEARATVKIDSLMMVL